MYGPPEQTISQAAATEPTRLASITGRRSFRLGAGVFLVLLVFSVAAYIFVPVSIPSPDRGYSLTLRRSWHHLEDSSSAVKNNQFSQLTAANFVDVFYDSNVVSRQQAFDLVDQATKRHSMVLLQVPGIIAVIPFPASASFDLVAPKQLPANDRAIQTAAKGSRQTIYATGGKIYATVQVKEGLIVNAQSAYSSNGQRDQVMNSLASMQ